MKINLEIYNPEKTYLFPNMNVATPEIIQSTYPAVNFKGMVCVITTDVSNTIFYAVDLLQTLAERLGVDTSLYATDEEILIAMEEILNAPQPEPEPSAEERIASSMEYQNLLSM